jgi:hypothetical protein
MIVSSVFPPPPVVSMPVAMARRAVAVVVRRINRPLHDNDFAPILGQMERGSLASPADNNRGKAN